MEHTGRALDALQTHMIITYRTPGYYWDGQADLWWSRKSPRKFHRLGPILRHSAVAPVQRRLRAAVLVRNVMVQFSWIKSSRRVMCLLEYEYVLGNALLHRTLTLLLLKLKILTMLPHDIVLVPRNQKRKLCSDSQPIVKFAKPVRMADAPRERVANADRPKLQTSAVENSAAEADDRAISVLLLPCCNESGAETVSISRHKPSSLLGVKARCSAWELLLLACALPARADVSVCCRMCPAC